MAEANTVGNSPADVGAFALRPGMLVGRYEIVSVLGQGGFGITYRARDTVTGREVAIKEYLPVSLAIRQAGISVLPRSTEIAEDFTWGRERFVAESRTLASLNDAPAIVRTYDFIEANGTAYIVMELLHGETLESRLKRRRSLAPAEIDTMLGPLLDGLERVHGAGFLHRDIKPANLIVDADGRATLIDFGAARVAVASRSTALTAVFTPGFGAPEQFTTSNQGPWTDIYGLAATLHNAVTGVVPPSSFDRVVEDGYRPLALQPGNKLPTGLAAGIDTGLRLRVGDRPQSIAAWRPVLSGAMIPESATTTIVMRDTGSRTARPRRFALGRTGLIAAVVLVVVAAAGGGYWLDSRLRPAPIALENLKAEDLEKALAARRRADAEAEQKRQAEEQAKQKVATDTEAKRLADEELAKAQAERVQAEQELARMRAKQEAERTAAAAEEQRRAETEMAERRKEEEAARAKVAAEAEQKRLADEALAKAQQEREQAEAAAQVQAEAEARMRAETEAREKADAKAAAGKAEAALNLPVDDRKRLQIALTSLGFDTRGSDGNFGPRTREMVAAWQTARRLPPTGFVDANQQKALLREGSAAITKYDEEQKKIEDEKKAAEEKKKQEVATAAPPPAAASYGGAISISKTTGGTTVADMNLKIDGGTASGQIVHRLCGAYPVILTASTPGNFKGRAQAHDGGIGCQATPYEITATLSGDALKIDMNGIGGRAVGTLNKGVIASSAAPAPPTPPPSASAPVRYGGSLNIDNQIGASAVGELSLTMDGGTLTGEIAVRGCASAPVKLSVSASGQVSGTVQASNGARFCTVVPFTVTGQVSGGTISLDMKATGAKASGTLSRRTD